MRYEFEVGDYVKLIANQSLSSHSIGYIGKVAKVQNFPRAEMPGIWYDIDGGGATWSHYSELVPATKVEYYEAQNKPKPKFKVGDWVTDDNARNVYKIGRIYNGKYYPSSSSWYTTQNGKLANTSLSFSWDLRLATEAEVKQHLLAEASRRGFKVGVDYTLNGNRNTAITNPELYVNSISRFNLHCGYGCGLIYNDSTGEWATILPAEKELYGYKVNKTKGSSLINIGCKAISEGEIQGFLNVCEKFSITGVYSEYVKGQSIGLDAIKEALK